MFIVKESEREYRFGESGPKYLMKGPQLNFAVVRLRPGEDFHAHYHNVMEENFYVLEGRLDIVVNGIKHALDTGDLIHVEPREVHYLINSYGRPAKLVSVLAPYQEADKVNVDDPA